MGPPSAKHILSLTTPTLLTNSGFFNEPEPEPLYRVTPKGVNSGGILGDLREIWAAREIISALAHRQLRLRYKGSFFGVLWSMIPPIIQVVVLTIVVGVISGAPSSNNSAYIFCAFLPWIFVSNALLDGSSSVLAEQAILKKTYFPREVLPLASLYANFLHFCVAVGVFLVYRYGITTAVFHWPGLPPRAIFMLPLVVFDMLMLTTGMVLFLSAWTTFYEDVKYAIVVTLQLLFYLLPILYFAERIVYSVRGSARTRELVYHLYLANPVAWIVQAFKQMFFGVQPIGTHFTAQFDFRYYALTTATSLIVLILGYSEFRRMRWKFVERP